MRILFGSNTKPAFNYGAIKYAVLSLSLSLCSHVELPFHWRIIKPHLCLLLPGESPELSQRQFQLATDDAFQVRPPAGVLAPCQDEEFLLTFCPKEVTFRGDVTFYFL